MFLNLKVFLYDERKNDVEGFLIQLQLEWVGKGCLRNDCDSREENFWLMICEVVIWVRVDVRSLDQHMFWKMSNNVLFRKLKGKSLVKRIVKGWLSLFGLVIGELSRSSGDCRLSIGEFVHHIGNKINYLLFRQTFHLISHAHPLMKNHQSSWSIPGLSFGRNQC